jgi:hypothetical protein
MPRFTIWTPGIVSSYDGGFFEIFGLSTQGKRHLLHTTQFHQGGPELRQIVSGEPVSWDVEVPEGAQLFSVTGGVFSGHSKQFWVGWRLDRGLHMQALMQEKPIDTDLVPGEVPIFPAILDGAGRAALYSWRASGSGTALWRRVFSGDIHQPSTVTAAQLSEVPAQPVVAFAGTVPGESSQHALLGWLEDTADGARMGLASVRPDGVRILRSEPIPGTASVARQRLGIWAASHDHFELAAILQTREGTGGYDLARFTVSPSSDKGAVTRIPLNLSSGIVHSAAVDYYKNNLEPRLHQTFVTTDGLLLAASGAGKPPLRQRRASSLDDPLPVVTITNAVFCAYRSEDDRVSFGHL